jgi:para-nitrobenzyl esterase
MAKTTGIVQTAFGQVSGVPLAGKYEGITEFRGIPYAAPPVGALRFRAPEDPACWEGVKVCDTYAPMAMQDRQSGLGFEPYSSDFYWEGYPACSEDCLYLNVATPADLSSGAPGRYPVFIWFHGGGLADGYSYEPVFDPSELARKGVWVVSVGQRLNLFGYIALPQLTAEQGGKSGNYGLMDEVKALDWVCANIAAFGGDPDNITVGGQSGGPRRAARSRPLPKPAAE